MIYIIITYIGLLYIAIKLELYTFAIIPTIAIIIAAIAIKIWPNDTQTIDTDTDTHILTQRIKQRMKQN